MPFSAAKFHQIKTAMSRAMRDDQLELSDRMYLQNLASQIETQGARIRLQEREISRLEDILAPFSTAEAPRQMQDPFKRYPVQTEQTIPSDGAVISIRPLGFGALALALLVWVYAIFVA